MQGRSVLDEAIAGSGRVGDLHHELEALNHAMEHNAEDMDRILARFGEAQEEYEHLDGYALKRRPAKCCTARLSGRSDRRGCGRAFGRLEDARGAGPRLVRPPRVLLMDEPPTTWTSSPSSGWSSSSNPSRAPF